MEDFETGDSAAHNWLFQSVLLGHRDDSNDAVDNEHVAEEECAGVGDALGGPAVPE